jgi:hypothetical protein
MIINHDSGPGLLAAKDAKWERVKALRAEKLAAGCTIPGVGAFQTDERSMANIHEAVTGALLAAAAQLPYTIEFTLADNTRPTFNGAQMMAIGKVVGERKSAIHDYSQDVLKVAIYAATDHAALDAIDIETGWPA